MKNQPLPNKSLGQHWLYDDASLGAMADAVDIQAGDTVLEIGPGLGTLTKKLLLRGATVQAVEFDSALAESLASRLGNPDKLTVHEADILRFDLGTLPPGYKVAANIPYYLTSKLLRVLSEAQNPPLALSLLVQKEVAQRAAANPPDMSMLALTVQWYYHASLGRLVPAMLFTPPPKVDSQILILNRREAVLDSTVESRKLFGLMRTGFASKRKTLLNALSAHPLLERETLTIRLERCGISPMQRAETLSLEDWCKLYHEVYGVPKT